jgi:hypothetical protein
MSEKKYREFTPEFKKQALELLKRGDKSAAELERELGITPGGHGIGWSAAKGRQRKSYPVKWKRRKPKYDACSVSWPMPRKSVKS